MALTCSELPIIDFSKEAMKPGTTTWDLTGKHLRKALEEYGCFVATFNGINDELHSAFFGSLEKLFDLPKDTKRRFTSNEPIYGYSSDLPQKPLLETMGLTDPLSSQSIQNLALLMWPQGDATFCENLNSYVTQVLELEKRVRKMIFQIYGLERHFEKESKSMKCPIGLMKYGAPMTDKDTHGLDKHNDKNFLTILQSNGVGLQVQTKDGEWISVTPSVSSLVVVMGESSFGWSNGRIRCCPHRVRLSGSKPRYSVGFFSTKEGKTEIPSELVDEEHPLMFKPFDHADLLTKLDEDDNVVPTITTYFSV